MPAAHRHVTRHTAGLQVKNSQGEDVREDVMIDPEEQHDLDNSRGTCNFCLKWDKGARHQVSAAGRQGRAGQGRAGELY